ncbi:MAG: hypothetical protein WBW87_15740 [Candidatus Cybelea sp.]
MRIFAASILMATLAACTQGGTMPATQTFVRPGTVPNATAGQYLYVLECCAGYGDITVYNAGLKGIARTIAARNPSYMALGRDGTLYVVNGWSQITVYGRGSGRPTRKLTGYNWLVGVATDAQSNLYAIDCESCQINGAAPSASGEPGTKGDRIDVYSPGGKQLLRTIGRYVRAPHAITFDSHENLYVVNGSAEYHYLRPSISVYKPGASSPFRRITTGRMKQPVLIAIDKADNVFVNTGSDSVLEYAAGSSKVVRTITDGISSVDAIALDSTGTLYVANASQLPSHGWISVYPLGETHEAYRITDGVNEPAALRLDQDDNLYVSNDGYWGRVRLYLAGERVPHKSVKNHNGYPGALALGPR